MKKFYLSAFLFLVSYLCYSQKNEKSKGYLKSLRYLTEESFKAKNYRLALDYGKKLDSIQPNQEDIKYKIGVSYLFSHSRRQALEPLLFAKSKNFNANELEYYLGQAYQYNHKFADAINSFNNVLATTDTTSKASIENQKLFKDVKTRIAQCKNGIQMVNDSLNVEVRNLGYPINSPYSEYVPIVNADESLMYFTSRRLDSANQRLDIDNMYFEEVYVSTFENGSWQEAKNLGEPVNSDDHDACIGISPDGQKLFIYRSLSAKAKLGDIFEINKDGNEWKNSKKLGSQINSRGSWESSICLSQDEKRLYFSSDRDGGYGGFDIYYTELTPQGDWGTPVNMGKPINSTDNEDAPFLHFDGKTLFFSRDGNKTMGGFDVLSSNFMPDSGRWSNPTNLGYPINSADDDLYFIYSADGSTGYFASHRSDSYGDKDIYLVNRPNSDPNMIVLSGNVLDKETRKPLDAVLTVTNLESHEVIGVYKSNKETGKYVLALNFDVNHSIEIESEGYVFNSENVNVSKKFFKLQHNKDFYLDKAKKGASVTLNNLFFEFGKAKLQPQSLIELDNIYELVHTHPTWQIEIGGHTDSIDSDDYNLRLSKERALSVVNYLIEKGVNPKNLLAVGYGETKPIAENGTEEGRQRNRRTELIVRRTDVDIPEGEKALSARPTKFSIDDVLEKAGNTDSSYKLKMKVHFLLENGEVITPYSQRELDKVLTILKKENKFRLTLAPHVDDVRNEFNNKDLYELRAKTITEYLVEKGIARERINVKAFEPSSGVKLTELSKSNIHKRKVEFWVSQ